MNSQAIISVATANCSGYIPEGGKCDIDGRNCDYCQTDHTTKIESTAENWENGLLGRDERYIEQAPAIPDLDQTVFVLNDEQTAQFMKALETPMSERPALMKLLNSKSPWGEKKRCLDCNDTGLSHCSDPLNCGGPWTE